MLKTARHRAIAAMVQDGRSVVVNDLAERFQTSPFTIRRDLIELEERGLLSRTRGGAVPGQDMVLADGWARYETISYSERERENQRQKRAIAEAAAQFVSDGDCILINGGTTCRQFAEALRGHTNLHVVTNGLTIAMELASSQRASVFLLPGSVDFHKMASVMRPSPDLLGQITVRAAFLGVHAVSVNSGIGMLTAEEAAMNRAFIEAAGDVTILVDSTKFRSQALFRIAHLDRINRIITDTGLPDDEADQIEKLGIAVIRAELED